MGDPARGGADTLAVFRTRALLVRARVHHAAGESDQAMVLLCTVEDLLSDKKLRHAVALREELDRDLERVCELPAAVPPFRGDGMSRG